MSELKLTRVRKRVGGDTVLEALRLDDVRNTAPVDRWIHSGSLSASEAYVKIWAPPSGTRDDALYLNQYRYLDGEQELEFTTRVRRGEWVVCDPTIDPAYEAHYTAYDDHAFNALFEVVSE